MNTKINKHTQMCSVLPNNTSYLSSVVVFMAVRLYCFAKIRFYFITSKFKIENDYSYVELINTIVTRE